MKKTELKTLKDILSSVVKTIHFKPIKTEKEFTNWLNGFRKNKREELKANAIECAKYFRNQYEHFDKVGLPETFNYYRGRFDEVMERNNLTEENLE